MLAPEESELRGSWVMTAAGQVSEDLVCQRIRALVEGYLSLVATPPDSWRKLYRDSADQRYWELSYPQAKYMVAALLCSPLFLSRIIGDLASEALADLLPRVETFKSQ